MVSKPRHIQNAELEGYLKGAVETTPEEATEDLDFGHALARPWLEKLVERGVAEQDGDVFRWTENGEDEVTDDSEEEVEVEGDDDE